MFDINQQYKVENEKPATVVTYDYYKTGELSPHAAVLVAHKLNVIYQEARNKVVREALAIQITSSSSCTGDLT